MHICLRVFYLGRLGTLDATKRKLFFKKANQLFSVRDEFCCLRYPPKALSRQTRAMVCVCSSLAWQTILVSRGFPSGLLAASQATVQTLHRRDSNISAHLFLCVTKPLPAISGTSTQILLSLTWATPTEATETDIMKLKVNTLNT